MNLEFDILKPQTALAGYVQAIWSASVKPDTTQTVRKQLLSDAGTGVVFILQNEVQMDGEWQAPGVILLPVSILAHQVCLPPGAVMTGVRFHPAVGYQLFGKRLEQLLRIQDDHPLGSSALATFESLQTARSPSARISTLYRWVQALIEEYEPQSLTSLQGRSVSARESAIFRNGWGLLLNITNALNE
ncbi:DUF6597 domain-containing transcriptional factor [Vibrio diabolicus]|uniref:DUF6597 domain-containing transcriptional factor n=1 Tax=Vibrio diabolicus TaxID=50719 RepID=UPI001D03F8EE